MAKTRPSISIGHQFAVMVAPDGTLWGWGKLGGKEFGFGPRWQPQQISKENDWRDVTAGYHGFVAVKQDGSLWGMGSNAEGLLGVPEPTNDIPSLIQVSKDTDWKEVRAGVAHCMALKNDGSLWTWGQNNYGQIGIGAITPREPPTRITEETNWVAISPGAFQSYALRGDGTIWGWGLGFNTSRNDPSPLPVSTNANWRSIAAGEYHLAAVHEDGSSWIVGANAHLIVPDKQGKGEWVRLNEATNWVEIVSGENCLMGRNKEGGWFPAGNLYYGSWKWNFPAAEELIGLASQRGTTLLLTRDGRLWSLGRRVGGEPRLSLAAKMGNLLNRLRGIRGMAQPQEPTDTTPYLIWEHR